MPRSAVTSVLTVASLAPGGRGVAHMEHGGERRAVFIEGVTPGDRVRVEADFGSRPARGVVLELLEPGPERVPSPCSWAETCGACDWMHLGIKAQTRIHAEHLTAALPAAWRSVPIDVHEAREALSYRVRARVHVRCGRGGRVSVGMHGTGTHEPVEVTTCVVLHPVLDRARQDLALLFAGCTGRGEVQLALGASCLPVLEVSWSGEVPAAVFGRLERHVASGAIAGARILVGDATRPATVGDPTPWMAGADGLPVRLAPGGFGQANDAMNTALASHVGALAASVHAKKAVELYAGAGNLSVVLARAAGELVCVEASREGCEATRANLEARGLAARVVEADVDGYVWKATTDLVVLDPPRTGARAAVERLSGSRVAHVFYVSCDAQTLGRDLARLEGSFELRSLATFEMFPQTSHVEIVAQLYRRRP